MEPEDDREVLRRKLCVKLEDNNHNPGELKSQTLKDVKLKASVKLKDDIHNPGEINGQMMALKQHVKAHTGYRI